MGTSTEKTVAVVGTGLVGCLAALAFANKLGWKVNLYDSRSAVDKAVADNKVINLALSNRGIRAFRDVDPQLADDMVAAGVPLRGRLVHDLKGRKSQQDYSPRGDCIYSINRSTMNKLLNDACAASPLITMHYNHKLIGCTTSKLTFVDPTTGIESTATADLIVGADGVYSAVRAQMQKQVKMDTATRWSPLSYMKIEVPPKVMPEGSLEHALEPGVLHLWPRSDFLLIAPSNPDKTFTCVLWAKDELLKSLNDPKVARAFFKREFPSFLDAIPLEDVVKQASELSLVPMCSVKCFPLNGLDNIVLVGDAAHTIVPYLGHGANVGYEDVRVLLELLTAANPDEPLQKTLDKYSVARRDDLEAIDEVSWHHIKVLSQDVLTSSYLARKRFDFALNTIAPKLWAPLYASVMFDDVTSYAKIVDRERWQDSIVRACQLGLTVLVSTYCARLVLA